MPLGHLGLRLLRNLCWFWTRCLLFIVHGALLMINERQRLLLAQLYTRLSMVDSANDTLDKKAITLIQVNSLLVAVAGIIGVDQMLGSQKDAMTMFLLLISAAAFLITIACSFAVWFPGRYAMPGSVTWDDLHERYLNVSDEAAFLQILSNLSSTIQRLDAINAHKSQLVKIGFVAWVIELLVLLVIAVSQ